MLADEITLAPDRAAIKSHLEHLFGRAIESDYRDGLVEIAWTKSTPDEGGRYRLSYARQFALDQIDEAVEHAATTNATPNVNVYVGAALRKPETFPGARAKDSDFYAATAVHGDLDDAGPNANARRVFGDCAPTFVCCTGSTPHPRHQMWWALETPISDPAEFRRLGEAIAAEFGGDPTVANPSRVMRLAGTIAWPHKPGRVAEVTRIVRLKNFAQPDSYPIEAVERAYAPATLLTSATTPAPAQPIVAPRPAPVLSSIHNVGKLHDGREKYGRDLVAAHLAEFVRQNGTEPTEAELFDEVWPVYRRNVDLTRPGRGPDELRAKIRYAIKRFREGRISSARSVDHVLEMADAARAVERAASEFEAAPKGQPPKRDFEWLTNANAAVVLDAAWLIKRFLPAGGLGVIYGRPGSGKTFSCLDIAMHVALGRPWRGLKVEQKSVSYVSPEAGRLGANRVIGWCRHHREDWPDGFRLSPVSINLRSSPDDAIALIEDIKANQPACGLVIIDTLNRAMAGGDENSSEDMGAFVRMCDAVAKATGALVLIVHHSGKDATKGSRGHSSLLGAVSVEIEITREQGMPGLIKNTKQRDGEDGAEYGFDLTSVPLGKDCDGEEVTTAVAVEGSLEKAKSARSATPSGAHQKAVARAFDQYVSDYGLQTPVGTGFPEPGVVRCVEVDGFINFAGGKLACVKPEYQAGRAITSLKNKGYFVINGGLMWRPI